ncbi:hypothetical protein H6F74_22950 [Trichocoleus sp. FACHB-90]|uniref:hypothetical protein n=1 Tax=Cyanophyceae TaxID=3028117 RepID=UPI0016841E00|nr:hypothetical protein [Trichocoleus sp. FACHB-90]MBD1929080.1 hypothetical protein [Trichocoleus sp. FACHB-90]
MLEKFMVAATLTFSLNLFLGHSWSNTPLTYSKINLQETADQIVSLLPLANHQAPESADRYNSAR